METVTVQTAYDEIVAHIRKEGSGAGHWYAGIASDWKDRLQDHGVDTETENHWYIARECEDDESARSVEEALIEYVCDGGGGGGSKSTTWVYAYRKTASTDP